MATDRETPLRALAEAFVRQPGASMEQLAQAIGVSRATLHRLVSSRDELLAELEEFAYRTCTETFDSVHLEEGPPADALGRLVSAMNPNANLYLFLLRTGAMGKLKLENRWEGHRRKLVQFFQRGQEQGVFRVDVSAQWLVEALGALLHAAAEAAYDGRLARADMDHVVCTLLLDGARRRPT